MARLSYLRQVEICESVRTAIKQAIAQSDDLKLKTKTPGVPSTESILRAASLSTNLDSDEKLNDFVRECIINELRLSEIQMEYLRQRLSPPVQQSDASIL